MGPQGKPYGDHVNTWVPVHGPIRFTMGTLYIFHIYRDQMWLVGYLIKYNTHYFLQ